jgi:Xaa-Pro aminopeptidase
MSRITEIQKALAGEKADGWLLYDFHRRDPLSYRILGLSAEGMTTRRWFYFIPKAGEPVRIVHPVEKWKLDALPGEKIVYMNWRQLHEVLKQTLAGCHTVAMNYSPLNHIPYVSLVDAGTVELIRSFGVEVVTAANLIQTFEAVITEEGYKLHAKAQVKVDTVRRQAFELIEQKMKAGERLTEVEVQQFILKRFEEEGLTCDGDPPIVGVNEHPADPHFCPTAENSHAFKKGDCILIDLWARVNVPEGIYYDITWCGFAGKNPPAKYVEIFDVVVRARKRAVEFIRERFAAGALVHGWEVDAACRKVVEDAGYGKYFVHRTGHSIGREVHGNGVNIDNLETKDERLLLPGLMFSVEPGIYLEGEMAVRTEIDPFIRPGGQVEVTGEEQQDLVLLDV